MLDQDSYEVRYKGTILQTSLHQDYLSQDWSCQQAQSNAWDSKLRYIFDNIRTSSNRNDDNCKTNNMILLASSAERTTFVS